MGKVLTSPLITNIKQKVGAVVFQGTAGGIAVRVQKAKSPTKPTAAQAYIARYRDATALWKNILTQTERTAWAATAAANPIKDVFNADVFLAGYQFFLHINLPLLATSQPPLTSPPTDFSSTSLTAFTASAGHAAPFFQIDSVSPALVATDALNIGVRPFTSASSQRIPASLPTLLVTAGNPAFPVDLTVAYLKRYGTIQQGMTIGITIHTVRTGTGVYTATIYGTVDVS